MEDTPRSTPQHQFVAGLVQHCSKGGVTYHLRYAKHIAVFRWVVPLGLNSVTNTEAYGGRTCLPVLGFLSSMSILFIYITMAQMVEKNAGLRNAWQKMMRLFTDLRGIDAKPRSIWIPGVRHNACGGLEMVVQFELFFPNKPYNANISLTHSKSTVVH